MHPAVDQREALAISYAELMSQPGHPALEENGASGWVAQLPKLQLHLPVHSTPWSQQESEKAGNLATLPCPPHSKWDTPQLDHGPKQGFLAIVTDKWCAVETSEYEAVSPQIGIKLTDLQEKGDEPKCGQSENVYSGPVSG